MWGQEPARAPCAHPLPDVLLPEWLGVFRQHARHTDRARGVQTRDAEGLPLGSRARRLEKAEQAQRRVGRLRPLQLRGGVGLSRLVRRCEPGEPVGVRDERDVERGRHGRDERVEWDAARVCDVERVGAWLGVKARHLEHCGGRIWRGNPSYGLGVPSATAWRSSWNGTHAIDARQTSQRERRL